MKKRIFLVCCVAVLLASFCLATVSVVTAERRAEEFDTVKALSGDDKLAAAVSVIYKRAGELMLTMPYASINLSQTALMKVYSGELNDAIMYLNTHADDELQNAYDAMTDILNDFDKLLTQYNVPSNSSYRTKRAELATLFSGVKSSSDELIRRTRTLITYSNTNYDNYYTAYCEQMQKLTDKLHTATDKIDAEYGTLMKGLIGTTDYSTVS